MMMIIIYNKSLCNITLPQNGPFDHCSVLFCLKLCLQRVNVTLVCVCTRFDNRTIKVKENEMVFEKRGERE